MSHQKSNNHMKFEYEPEQKDVRTINGGTYKDIKEYIYNKYKTKMPTLYIAQIKRKFGIEMWRCYAKIRTKINLNVQRIKRK